MFLFDGFHCFKCLQHFYDLHSWQIFPPFCLLPFNLYTSMLFWITRAVFFIVCKPMLPFDSHENSAQPADSIHTLPSRQSFSLLRISSLSACVPTRRDVSSFTCVFCYENTCSSPNMKFLTNELLPKISQFLSSMYYFRCI